MLIVGVHFQLRNPYFKYKERFYFETDWCLGLALTIALVAQWNERQWRVPKSEEENLFWLPCGEDFYTRLCSSAESSPSSLCFFLKSPVG